MTGTIRGGRVVLEDLYPAQDRAEVRVEPARVILLSRLRGSEGSNAGAGRYKELENVRTELVGCWSRGMAQTSADEK